MAGKTSGMRQGASHAPTPVMRVLLLAAIALVLLSPSAWAAICWRQSNSNTWGACSGGTKTVSCGANMNYYGSGGGCDCPCSATQGKCIDIAGNYCGTYPDCRTSVEPPCVKYGPTCLGTASIACAALKNELTCTSVGCIWTAYSCTVGPGGACSTTPPPCCQSGLNCAGGACCVPPGSLSFSCSGGPDQGTCCSGSLCSQAGKCVMCHDNSMACSSASQCCDSMSCEGSPKKCCMNAASTGTCADSTDCCAGLQCNVATGKCGAPCKTLGEKCPAGTCCASPLFCDAQNSNPAVCQDCLPLGAKCSANPGKCCGAPITACTPTGAADATCTSPAPPICGTASISNIFWLAGLAALGTGIMIALAYMFGEFFQNARVLTWAKTEALQVFVSLIIVGAVLGSVQLFCTLEVGEVASIFTPLPQIYQAHQTGSIYEGATIYLEKLMDASQTNMRSLRYIVGAYEIRTSYTEMICKGSCFISLTGYNQAKYGGETLQLAIANNLLSTATISYLSAAFEYFTLQYILNGLFMVLLPLAIIIRSIPFMRQFAGALVAIFLALYIMYPTMLVLNATMAPGMVGSPKAAFYLKDCEGLDLFAYKGGAAGAVCEKSGGGFDYDEANLGGSVGLLSADVPYAPNGSGGSNSLQDYIRTNGLIFLLTVFLSAFNFIAIAAVARGLSHFLGEEVDISRLGQMI